MLATNTNLIIDKGSKYYDNLLLFFRKVVDDEVIKPLYHLNDDEDLILDRGLRFLLPEDIRNSFEDVSTHDIDIPVNPNPDFYKNILNGITLRDDQILTVMKCLYHKRGLVQAATGSGKSICIAAILKYYEMMLGYYPTTIIFEPTNYLVDDMISRFNDYGIPAKHYSECRGNIHGVVISHPMSLYNDLMKNESVFEDVKIFIGDEFHHQACNTWHSIYNGLSGIEVSLGFSASIIDQDKLPILNISQLSYEESVIVGCTGAVIVNYPPSFFIERGILAKPVVFRMKNLANEWVYDDQNWHQLRTKKLESKARTLTLCKVVEEFNRIGYKTLILTGTKKHSYDILDLFKGLGIGDKVVCSFGGGEYYKLDNGSVINCCDENPKSKFDNGEFTIMIGTTHLYEGADIPNLDVVVLASVGKQVRKLIQGVGRSLRRSKTGHYAYIIDFDDVGNGVLNYHSNTRMNGYHNIIGVKSEDTYDHCTLPQFKEILKRLENLEG